MAKVIIASSTDKTVLFAVREFLPQRFQAPGWTDLRIGFFLSIVGPEDPTDDDDPTAVAPEEIGTPPVQLHSSDRFFIGVLDSATGQVFMGFTNCGTIRTGTDLSFDSSKLESSDGGIGAGSDFWYPFNTQNKHWSMQIIDHNNTRAISGDGSQIHFAQDVGGAGGYATLLMLRLQRDNAAGRSKIISVSTKRDITNHTANVLFTGTPTAALLESHLIGTFPSPAQTLGPVELTQEPDSLYIYWPFHDSRLRCHAAGIYKAS